MTPDRPYWYRLPYANGNGPYMKAVEGIAYYVCPQQEGTWFWYKNSDDAIIQYGFKDAQLAMDDCDQHIAETRP